VRVRDALEPHRRRLNYLRTKIDKPFDVTSIETVRGTGYRIDADGGRR